MSHMAADPRFCSNCRAELPAKAEACPTCGVFAGDLYDERMHRPRTRFALFAALLFVAIAAAGAAVWWKEGRAIPGRPQKVVRRAPPRAPGPVKNDAEAIRIVRRHLVETVGLENRCVVLLGRGLAKGGYVVRAQNHCTDTRMGDWRVDAKTGKVTRPR